MEKITIDSLVRNIRAWPELGSDIAEKPIEVDGRRYWTTISVHEKDYTLLGRAENGTKYYIKKTR
jgi:hypothetical protein